jgi:hypothetical protein
MGDAASRHPQLHRSSQRRPAVDADRPVLRPFGKLSAHLDIDLSGNDYPSLVTTLLGACEKQPVQDARILELWNLPVSARIARLIELVGLTLESSELCTALRCSGCRQPIGIKLNIRDLLALAPQAGHNVIPFRSDFSGDLRFRRATGQDQQQWQNTTYANSQAALLLIAQSLLIDAHRKLQFVELESIGETLEECDPLAAFRVECTCPQCGQNQRVALDLQVICITQFHEYQHRLFQELHALATAYGWSEQKILSLPSARRRRYLALID